MSRYEEAFSTINQIIENTLYVHDSIKELTLNESNRFFYLERGELKYEYFSTEKDYILKDEFIIFYQQELINEKLLSLKDDKEKRQALLDKINSKLEEEGEYNYSYIFKWEINLRISWTIWDWWKSYMTIRKIEKNILDPADLHIPHDIIEILSDYKKWWLVIFNAPPGEGKSTSMASLVNYVSQKNIMKVVTMEDPVEYIYPKNWNSLFEQRELWFDFNSYESWIKACLRLTPNLVIIQEMTTNDIIHQALALAKKWILVVSTLHSLDSVSAISQIIESFEPERRKEVSLLLKNSLKSVISQRLVLSSDKTKMIPIFEYITNTSEYRSYLNDWLHANLYQIMNHKWHLTFDDDINRKLSIWEIDRESVMEKCPESRIRKVILK